MKVHLLSLFSVSFPSRAKDSSPAEFIALPVIGGFCTFQSQKIKNFFSYSQRKLIKRNEPKGGGGGGGEGIDIIQVLVRLKA